METSPIPSHIILLRISARIIKQLKNHVDNLHLHQETLILSYIKKIDIIIVFKLITIQNEKTFTCYIFLMSCFNSL